MARLTEHHLSDACSTNLSPATRPTTLRFNSVGYFQRPDSFPMGSIFNNGFGGKLPVSRSSGGMYDGIAQDPNGIWPEGPYNSNPTYTYRDNITKIIGRHNLQFGAYFVAGQKNELSSVQVNGALTFDTARR